MRMTKMFTLTALFFIFSAQAVDICWIDKVQKKDNGVEIYFISSAQLEGVKDGSVYFINGSRVRINNKDERDSLFLSVDHTINLRQTRHDSCTYKTVIENGTLGVRAESNMMLPGLPLHQISKFIPAE